MSAPPINVVILSHMSPSKLLTKLAELSGRFSSRRFNIFLVRGGKAEDLEELKDLILSNYVWSISIYLLSSNDLHNLASKICEGRVVLFSSGEADPSLREHCRGNLEIEVVE